MFQSILGKQKAAFETKREHTAIRDVSYVTHFPFISEAHAAIAG